MKTEELFNYDKEISNSGYKYICGIDEAGRGPLAGPVSVCAVIMPMDEMIDGVNDSKKISEKKRAELLERIKEKAVSYKCVMLDNTVIDEINILEYRRYQLAYCKSNGRRNYNGYSRGYT